MKYGLEFRPLCNIDKIIETVNRMGIRNNKHKVIRPSCYVFRTEDDRFFLCHFKEMMQYEGSDAHVSEMDFKRRNLSFKMLVEWRLITPLVSPAKYALNNVKITVLPKYMLDEWHISPLYYPQKN